MDSKPSTNTTTADDLRLPTKESEHTEIMCDDSQSTAFPLSSATQDNDVETGLASNQVAATIDAESIDVKTGESILSTLEDAAEEKANATESCRTQVCRYGIIFGTFGTIMVLHYWVL